MKKLLAVLMALAMFVLPVMSFAEGALGEDNEKVVEKLIQSGKMVVTEAKIEIGDLDKAGMLGEEETKALQDLAAKLTFMFGRQSNGGAFVVRLEDEPILHIGCRADADAFLLGSNLLGDKVLTVKAEDIEQMMGNIAGGAEAAASLNMEKTAAALQAVMTEAMKVEQVTEWEENSDVPATLMSVSLTGKQMADVLRAALEDLQPVVESLAAYGMKVDMEAQEAQLKQLEENTNVLAVIDIYSTAEGQVAAFEVTILDGTEAAGEVLYVVGYHNSTDDPRSGTLVCKFGAGENAPVWALNVVSSPDHTQNVATLEMNNPENGYGTLIVTAESEREADEAENHLVAQFYATDAETIMNDPQVSPVMTLVVGSEREIENGEFSAESSLSLFNGAEDGTLLFTLKEVTKTQEADDRKPENAQMVNALTLTEEDIQELGTTAFLNIMEVVGKLVGGLPESMQQMIMGSMSATN